MCIGGGISDCFWRRKPSFRQLNFPSPDHLSPTTSDPPFLCLCLCPCLHFIVLFCCRRFRSVCSPLFMSSACSGSPRAHPCANFVLQLCTFSRGKLRIQALMSHFARISRSPPRVSSFQMIRLSEKAPYSFIVGVSLFSLPPYIKMLSAKAVELSRFEGPLGKGKLRGKGRRRLFP